MGSCVSRPKSCVGNKKREIRKKRRAGGDNSLPLDHAFTNPTFKGVSKEEAWFDSAAIFESDCSDDDFHSVPDDDISIITSPRLSIHKEIDPFVQSLCPIDHSATSINVSNYAMGISRSSVHPNDGDSRVKHEGINGSVKHVFLDDMSSCVDESGDEENGLFDHCGILPSNCLPCISSTISPVEKRISTSSSPHKKGALKIPFKWKEGNSTSTLVSSRMLLRRPIAGSQVPFCPLEKKIAETWSPLDPITFKVRGANYMRDKKKDFASNCAAYYPFGLDVFLSPRKINHIARFVKLPNINASNKLPPILVVNAQVPLYPATFFQNETDGEGISFVMYFKLSETYATDLPSHFQDIFRKVIDDEMEKVKGFAGDTNVSYRERVKILGRVVNIDELPLNAGERKVMRAYNEKPVLSRPQHEFYLGESYLEIDLDMHRFSYISRKGCEAFFDRLKFCLLDFGLTIQGNKAEELPEHMLCCVRLNEIDYVNYQQLGLN